MEFSKPKKIIIVDDDDRLNQALSDYLTRRVQHQVLAFNTGEECLKYIDDTTDVVVLDYELNHKHKEAASGLEILQAIKKHYPRIHIIILSSLERYSVALETIYKGAEQYVIKDEEAFEKISAMISDL